MILNRPMQISSTTNPTIKLMRSLSTAKEVRESGLFLVEGVRAIEDGLRAGFTPAHCVYNPDLVHRTERGRELINSLVSKAASTHSEQPLAAAERALAAASSTQNPQGIVAAFPVPTPSLHDVFTPVLAVVCDAVQDPGNLGTILRTAEAAGAAAVWLSPDCAFAYSPKVVRAGMGAHFRLPIFVDVTWAQIINDVEKAGVARDRIFATVAGAHTSYEFVDWRQPAAVIISNEAHGLSSSARRSLGNDASEITIPMLGGTESLNASVAAAVVLFEAARQRRSAT